MTEVFGSLAFLIALDVAIAVSIAASWRLTRFDFLRFGLAMMAFETARQLLSVAISLYPGLVMLQVGSSMLDFGCALSLLATCGAMTGRPIRLRWYTLLTGVYAVTLSISLLPIGILAAWLIANIAPVSSQVGCILVLARSGKRRSFGVYWLLGLIALSICFRVLLPFSVVTSESLFGAVYLLDSIIVSIMGAAIGLYSVERLARSYQIEQERTQESSDLIRTILDNAYDAVIVTNAGGTVLLWSRSAESTFGWPAQEATGQSIGRLISGIDRPLNTLPGEPFRTATRTRAGEPIVVDGVAFTIDRNGERRVVRILRDVTEQVKSETDLRTLEEQVRHVQRLESLGVFAGGVAHDYNNILAAIMSFADLGLHDAVPGSPVESCLREILEAAGRGSDLTRQILEYAGRSTTNATAIDVAMEIESIVPLLKSVISKKATLTTSLSGDTLRLRADRSQFSQVLLNLVSNASEALGDGAGRIGIRADTVAIEAHELSAYLFGAEIVPGEFVRLRIDDTGCGMSQDVLSKVFDPFYTTKPAGRGLGMATVSAIVRAHGGAIRVESELDVGTTATVLFPVVPVDASSESAPAAVASPHAGRELDPSLRGTVLVVDDEEAVRTAVSLILKRAGFSVITATDGIECLELLGRADGKVGLVVLDCNMPRMSGEEALDEILRHNVGLPVLLSSGKSRRAGGDHTHPNVQFIQKPYRATDLITKVNAMMGN